MHNAWWRTRLLAGSVGFIINKHIICPCLHRVFRPAAWSEMIRCSWHLVGCSPLPSEYSLCQCCALHTARTAVLSRELPPLVSHVLACMHMQRSDKLLDFNDIDTVMLNLCKEYLNEATFKTSVLLRTKNNCGICNTFLSYTEVTNLEMVCFCPPCMWSYFCHFILTYSVFCHYIFS